MYDKYEEPVRTLPSHRVLAINRGEKKGCLKVRLWIDRDIRMFLQAQQVDENRAVARQMWVRSVKKMQGRWMVQDIEVEARGSGHRTRLHVTDCE